MAKKYDLGATAVFTALAIPPVALVSFGASSGMDAALSAFNVSVDSSILFAGVFGVMMLAVGSKINNSLAIEKGVNSMQQSDLDGGYTLVSSNDPSLHSSTAPQAGDSRKPMEIDSDLTKSGPS